MRARAGILIAAVTVVAHAVACGGATEFAGGNVGPSGIASCERTIHPSSQGAPASGGSFLVEIATQQGCDWTAMSDESWISVTVAAGSGSGAAAYSVQPNMTASARQGRVHVGNLAVSVTQPPSVSATPPPPPPPPPPAPTPGPNPQPAPEPAPSPAPGPPSTPAPSGPAPPAPVDCGVGLSPDAQSTGVDGATFTAALSLRAGCAWAVTSDSWISVSPGSGSGSASLTVKVAANTSSSRSGAVRVGNRILTVTQAACVWTLTPGSQPASREGGSFTANVTAGAACPWTPSATQPWIRDLSGAGPGSRQISFKVDRHDGSEERKGEIKIGPESIKLTQAGAPPSPAPCTYAVDTTDSKAVGWEAGKFAVAIKTAAGCPWDTKKSHDWITVEPARGAGPATVGVSFPANRTREPRPATLVVAGREIRITQAASPPLK